VQESFTAYTDHMSKRILEISVMMRVWQVLKTYYWLVIDIMHNAQNMNFQRHSVDGTAIICDYVLLTLIGLLDYLIHLAFRVIQANKDLGEREESKARNELQGIHGEHIPPGPDKKLEVREFHGASVRYLRKEG